MALSFPQIDPIALQIGPLAIRWYALAYIGGILLGWRYALWLAQKYVPTVTRQLIDDAIFWATIGIVLGGRLGYILFYKADYYLSHPMEILMVWQGGMSFHGGFLGVLIAMILFCRHHRISPWPLLDIGACVTPIGLGLGRIANFINGELYGRVTDAPWGMVFPHGGDLPRHPSQLYQAFAEGFLMLAILYVCATRTKMLRYPAMMSGMFLILYGAFRSIGEIFREPDDFLGFLALGLTMGQYLSLPMIVAGVLLMIYARNRTQPLP